MPKGQVAWNKGLKRTWESPTEFKKGVYQGFGFKKGVYQGYGFKKGFKYWLGKHLSPEHKDKLSKSKLGHIPWNKGKIGVQKGKKKEDHWNWKGGITTQNHIIRNSKEYSLWRTAVFERDNYTCIWCGDNSGGNLEADHIKPFSLFPELRFAIDNGRTLCESCHKKTDTYGWNLYHKNVEVI